MRASRVLAIASLWLGAGCGTVHPDTSDDSTGTEPPQTSELLLAAGQSLVSGTNHTCALLTNGVVRCWGDNTQGQLGRGSSGAATAASPADPLTDPVTGATHTVNLGTGRTAKTIVAGPSHTCAILDNDQLKCWGDNTAGQLGQEDTLTRGKEFDESFSIYPTTGGMGDALPPVNLGTGRTAKAVAAGEAHTCVILDTNQVKCWGRAYEGPLGYGDGVDRGSAPGTMGDALPAVDLGTGRTAKAIAATSYRTTCAILDNNKVKCWGFDQMCSLGAGVANVGSYGYGSGSMGDALPYVNIGSGRTALSIKGGRDFFCVVRDNGTVKCWGDNNQGQIGVGSAAATWGCNATEMGDAGIVSMGGNDVTAVDLGEYHACAMRTSGEVRCWGANNDATPMGAPKGQLGVNVAPLPTKLTSPSAALSFGTGFTPRAITVGGYFSCAISTTNKAKCWGWNSYGQLGTNITAAAVGDVAGEMGSNLALTELTTRPVTQIAAGGQHTCAVLSGGAMKCWGANSVGQLGIGSNANRGDGPGQMGANLPAVSLGTGRTAKWLALGSNHTCAVMDNNLVKCWGSNWAGQLGYNDTTDRTAPPSSTVSLGTGLTAHTTASRPLVGAEHTCVLLSNSQVKCWGFGAEGALGYGDNNNRLAPPSSTVNLGTGLTAKAVVAGSNHTCVLLNTNQVKCWGANWHGQLGSGDTTSRNAPPSTTVNLGTGRTAKAIAAGGESTCAWLDTNQIKCWGLNASGQQGVGSTTDQLSPPSSAVNLGTSQSALGVTLGYAHVCALLATNQVKCWGSNSDYQTGTWQEMTGQADRSIGESANEMGDFLGTVFQGGGRSVKAMAAGSFHTCFLLDTDQVRCEGANSVGQLGQGNTNGYYPQGQGATLVDLGPDP